jgi:hypothetical protein
MFKRAKFELTGPICRCEEQKLSWGIANDGEGRYGLEITCKTCGAKLSVPHAQFVGGFWLDTPYPGPSKSTKPVSDTPDSDTPDNVIPFPKR